MKSNPILDENLSAISKYNLQLSEKILQIDSLKNSFEIVMTEANEPNWLYNGINLHNSVNAQLEAKNIFSKNSNTNLSIHIIFGFGLGYLPEIFAENSCGYVLIYEPNIEILAATLEIADLKNVLNKKNVFVYSDIAKFSEKFLSIFLPKSDITISYLQSYGLLFKKELNDFLHDVNAILGQAWVNNNYTRDKLIFSAKMVCSNLDLIINEPELADFENIYDGKAALVVSAGPSLDKCIDAIKTYRENVIIIAVGQSVRTLIKNGINPDFLTIIENYDVSSQIEGLNLSDIDLILEPFTNTIFHKLNVKNKLSYPSCTSIINSIWSQLAEVDSSKYFSSGTVSYTALYSALILGFKDIILVGQDLAFCGGKCYSKNASHKGLVYKKNNQTGKVEVIAEDLKAFANSLFSENSDAPEEVKLNYAKNRIESINNTLFYVDGVQGVKVPTTVGYATFINQFEKVAEKFSSKVKFYNTSKEGALIKGFENVDIADILSRMQKVERVDLKPIIKYNSRKIRENIKKEISLIDEIFKSFDMAQTYIYKFDESLSKNNEINMENISYFKQLLQLYIDITETYCQKSDIYFYLQKYAGIEVHSKLRENPQASKKSIKELYEVLKNYFLTVKANLQEVHGILTLKVEEYGKMLDSKS